MQREGKKEEKCESASCSCAGLYIFQRRVSLNPNKTVSDFHPVLACSGSFLPASPYTNRPLHFHVWVSFFLEQPTASCVREATEAPRSPATAAGVSGGRVPSGKWLRTGGNASLALGWQQKREPLQSLGQHQGSLADPEQEGLWGSSRMSCFCLSMVVGRRIGPVSALYSPAMALSSAQVIQETSGLQCEGGSEGNQYIPDSQRLTYPKVHLAPKRGGIGG